MSLFFYLYLASLNNNQTNPEYWPSEDIKYSSYKNYRELIREKNITSIPQIAQIVYKPTNIVIYEIQDMIDANYVLDIHINTQAETIDLGIGPRINTEEFLKNEYVKLIEQSNMPLSDILKWASDDKKRSDFEKYRTLIRDLNILSLTEISKRVQKSVQIVMLEIQLMIDEKYMLDIHIDTSSQTIVLSDGPRIDVSGILYTKHFKNTKCPNCGAINEFGEETCEYCGSALPLNL